MDQTRNKEFGRIISRLIAGQHLSEMEAYDAFCLVLQDAVSAMQQGAFLAALTAKGETAAEIAGGWRAVYQHDTVKVQISGQPDIIDNCGTGMDDFKTFNISTAASLVAACGGLRVARHGARAVTSSCGTVDVAEALGVDVDCSVATVASSIDRCGLGLFNGMSPMVHPSALGRILSQIAFGSPLNIAASLANPAKPTKAVRGVYSEAMLQPVLDVMQQIGYGEALVVHGRIEPEDLGIDEASVCGPTSCLYLQDKRVRRFTIVPEELGLRKHRGAAVAAKADTDSAAAHLVDVLSGRADEAARDIVALNSALLLMVGGTVPDLRAGVDLALTILEEGRALRTLQNWVENQNRDARRGREKLNRFLVTHAQENVCH